MSVWPWLSAGAGELSGNPQPFLRPMTYTFDQLPANVKEQLVLNFSIAYLKEAKFVKRGNRYCIF